MPRRPSRPRSRSRPRDNLPWTVPTGQPSFRAASSWVSSSTQQSTIGKRYFSGKPQDLVMSCRQLFDFRRILSAGSARRSRQPFTGAPLAYEKQPDERPHRAKAPARLVASVRQPSRSGSRTSPGRRHPHHWRHGSICPANSKDHRPKSDDNRLEGDRITAARRTAQELAARRAPRSSLGRRAFLALERWPRHKPASSRQSPERPFHPSTANTPSLAYNFLEKVITGKT